ncbi:MAG: NAD(P)/FAD-dependent oxidoreductase [Candidatus Aminicenantes bacterium]|nr:NAD(P)/FAD-dependent oxidoreductase [Candidatus Aminicenantes bacterium]
MNREYDVIVIGSGFGGPAAAKKCAAAGLKTLMIERAENPGEKIVSGLTIPFHGFLFGPDFIRDGNPPIERPQDGVINYIIKDIDKGDIDIDDSLMMPKPLSPIFVFGYNAYCKPFCEWEARQAVESGVELLTSTTVIDLIKEEGCVKGVVLESGEKIRSKIVIDAEGSQGWLAVKAGIREKYPPEAISLADTYDYEIPKEDLDRIFGFSLRFCWGWDEQEIAPPLGRGNGLMVWPYRNSIHFMQDQCLRMDQGEVPDLKNLFVKYHDNITKKLPWWQEEIEPRIKLRARTWQGFEIFVGLDEKLRNMPNHTDGMILIGDAAGLENTELCDGVPYAWFSADIAADVAIAAIKAGDTSKAFLKKYENRIKAHPLIQWAISASNRFNLREAQKTHDEKLLKKLIHNGWGLGVMSHFATPFVKVMLAEIRKNPLVIKKWVKMFFRYYHNWHNERFDYHSPPDGHKPRKRSFGERIFRFFAKISGLLFVLSSPVTWVLAVLFTPLTGLVNPLVKFFLLFERVFLWINKKLEPFTGWLSKKITAFVARIDPSIFEEKSQPGRK